ncbi:MAG: aldehyde ferredoxin oxidoreductase N-terminal domain-containing protein, partial [Candidatus Thorarchaeota archaeon]
MSRILRINMSKLSHEWEDVPKKYEALAGRAFTSTVVAEEVDPTCHPLREYNKFVISPGLLA